MNPIYSMTGFGRAEGRYKHKRMVVEIRSLNSKNFDLTVKIPSFYREKEYEIREKLAESIVRGKIEFLLTVELDASETAAKINPGVFLSYYEQLKEIYSQINKPLDSVILSSITRFPDIFETPREVLSDEEWQVVDELINTALSEFLNYRKTEGESIRIDMTQKVSVISQLLDTITSIAPSREQLVRDRLHGALAKLSQPEKFDPNRFEQEILYYLEKMDINEEQTRLRQHIRYFYETTNTGGDVGRKLGFIAQEMGREINTLGSKAASYDIQHLVVQMKDNLEQIKEQVLNIL